MILYQLAQWMEERNLLQKALRQTSEDPGMIQQQIAELEQQLRSHAERWRTSIGEMPQVQDPYQAPQLEPDALQ